ncbi:MAG: hypothetical protein RLO50_06810 [Azospirillaceae bacterium]
MRATIRILGLIGLVVLLFGGAARAQEQQAQSVVGDWQSEDGIRIQLNPDETYVLTGPLANGLERMSGQYRARLDQGFMLMRAVETTGGFRVDIVGVEDGTLTLSSEDVFGGEISFGQPYRVSDFLGADIGVFIGLTLVVFGFAAVMTGNALANGWQPIWKAIPYSLMLGAADRFLVHWLFDGLLLSLWGFVFHSAILFAIVAIAYRFTRARKMTSQYPWRYENAGLFGWREREHERA